MLLDGDGEQRNKKVEFGCYFSDAWIRALQLGGKWCQADFCGVDGPVLVCAADAVYMLAIYFSWTNTAAAQAGVVNTVNGTLSALYTGCFLNGEKVFNLIRRQETPEFWPRLPQISQSLIFSLKNMQLVWQKSGGTSRQYQVSCLTEQKKISLIYSHCS